MDDTLRKTILDRLKRDYAFTSAAPGARRWSGGKCPACGKKELYVYTENPWVVACGREDKCGQKWTVKDLYDDLFDNWSDRHPQTEKDPNAAAKAYLRDARGLNVVKLAGCYAQEWYQDRRIGQGTATVRFALPGGGWWERLIDRPQRFGKKKANFPRGYSYRGQAWHNPVRGFDTLAAMDEIWFAEGIFDTAALDEGFAAARPGAAAASTMSTNNYPEEWLRQLAEAVARRGTSARRPALVFAFDVGPAGVKFTRDYVERARADGWQARAAQVRADGEGRKLDWNDLLQRKALTAEDLETYLENGDITIAQNAAEKAFLLYRRSRRAEFPFTFKARQLWAKFSAERINEKVQSYEEEKTAVGLTKEEKYDRAAREIVEVSEIANCVFRTLYFQRDKDIDESSYYVRIDFPGMQYTVKANFPGPSMAASGEFKKRLISVAPGAQWTGSQFQMDKIMARQMFNIRTVDSLYFSGYSIEHGAWMFDDIAVTGGRVIELNEEDYFEIGKIGVKPVAASKDFAIDYDPDGINYDWWPDLWASFGSLGLVTLAFWLLSLFAEQIRREYQSLGFLEISGPPGSGKSTLLIFLWKLLGRKNNYEGFDPVTSSPVGIARELVKFGNIPVVMLEGDHNDKQPLSKKFNWSELKKIYNGHAPRTVGVRNGGTTTFAPPFRGALVIAQNEPIRDAEEAVLERIMPLVVDKSRFTDEGREAGNRLKRIEVDQVSHWMVAMIRQEKPILEYFAKRFAIHEKRFRDHPEVQRDRLAYDHAQLAAALDCLAHAMTVKGRPVITPEQVGEAHGLIERMCLTQHGAIGADHAHVVKFWESFDYLHALLTDGKTADIEPGLNLHRKENMIAVSMPMLESKFAAYRISIPGNDMMALRTLLKTSKSRKFVDTANVNCRDGKVRACWIFSKTEKQELPI